MNFINFIKMPNYTGKTLYLINICKNKNDKAIIVRNEDIRNIILKRAKANNYTINVFTFQDINDYIEYHTNEDDLSNYELYFDDFDEWIKKTFKRLNINTCMIGELSSNQLKNMLLKESIKNESLD